MVVRVPSRITTKLRKFCSEISNDSEPIFVRVKPESFSEINECFYNVRMKINRDGGRILNGWEVRIWPEVFIESEHHAVWVSDKNEFVDITPKPDKAQQCLFVPTPELVYDEHAHERRPKKFQQLRKDTDITRFIDIERRKHEFIEQNSIGKHGEISVPGVEMTRIEEESFLCLKILLKRYLGSNDPCFCGSGLKLKKCHKTFPPSI